MKYVLGILLIGFLAGCSDNPVDFKSEEVEGRVTKEELEVFNKLDQSIYYFVVERATAVSILWAPGSGKGNEIKTKRSKIISFENIYGYEEGKEIQFNYWTKKEPKYGDIKSIVILTD